MYVLIRQSSFGCYFCCCFLSTLSANKLYWKWFCCLKYMKFHFSFQFGILFEPKTEKKSLLSNLHEWWKLLKFLNVFRYPIKRNFYYYANTFIFSWIFRMKKRCSRDTLLNSIMDKRKAFMRYKKLPSIGYQ